LVRLNHTLNISGTRENETSQTEMNLSNSLVALLLTGHTNCRLREVVYILRDLRLACGLGLALLLGRDPRVGVDVKRPPNLIGEVLLVGERLLGLPLTGDDRPPSDSSSFLASCSRSILSRLGSRATLLSDVSSMFLISLMSSPVLAERLI